VCTKKEVDITSLHPVDLLMNVGKGIRVKRKNISHQKKPKNDPFFVCSSREVSGLQTGSFLIGKKLGGEEGSASNLAGRGQHASH